jgi:hypothetical protein
MRHSPEVSAHSVRDAELRFRRPAAYSLTLSGADPLSEVAPFTGHCGREASAGNWRSSSLFWDVTVPRYEAELNPHSPDLRRSAIERFPEAGYIGVSAGQRVGTMCPRPDTHLTYMINIVLTTEFPIPAGGAR